MTYDSEILFFLQTPAFSKYLNLNREGRGGKKTNTGILLRKKSIPSLEHNLLNYSEASRVEVHVQRSLSRDACLLATVTDIVG